MRPVPTSNSHAYSPIPLAPSFDDPAFVDPPEPVSETRLRAAPPKDADAVDRDELLASLVDALEDILRAECK
jgi:hypothetical protein